MTVKQWHLYNVAQRKETLLFNSVYCQILRAPRQTTFLPMRERKNWSTFSAQFSHQILLLALIHCHILYLIFSLSLHDNKHSCIHNSVAHLVINKAYFHPLTDKWYCYKSTKGSVEELSENCTSEATKLLPCVQ